MEMNTEKKLRVAAYCRVSTAAINQKTSFDGQIKTYREMIESNPKWNLVSIYADEGVTGTSVSKRPQFQKMIRSCEEGKIDLILTKSISRFARNTLECLTYVRYLNSMGVHLIFENNNIDTRTSFSEMLLTILAAFAQEESRSISENTTWGIRKRFEKGTTRWCKLYGYTKTEKAEYEIVPEQAAVVRKIFWLYEHGKTIKDIRVYMKEHHIPSPKGAETWGQSAVHTMLINERYMGDIILQKFHIENHITHKAIRNDGTKVPSYYIKNHHTPIISRSQFERCQRIMSMRKVTGRPSEYDIGTCNQYPLGDKLRCPYCSSILYQRKIPVQTNQSTGWSCERGENACHGFIIRSKFVEHALLKAYNKLEPDMIKGQSKGPISDKDMEQGRAIKRAYPLFHQVDYWWVDDLIDHIEFGLHTWTQGISEEINSSESLHDCVMHIFWKWGTITTIASGVTKVQDSPGQVAKLYNTFLKRRTESDTV